MSPRSLALAALLVTLAACGGGDPPLGLVCTAEARASVAVRMLDANTKATINAGSTLVLVDGAWRDSTAFPATDTFWNDGYVSTWGSFERPGTYTVIARRAGYLEATREGIEVTKGPCHVHTQSLVLELTPG